MTKRAKPTIDWNKVEYLCLSSFTGKRLSDEEMDYLKAAHASDPKQYAARTEGVRNAERSRLRSM